jgi:hypothetical protein
MKNIIDFVKRLWFVLLMILSMLVLIVLMKIS